MYAGERIHKINVGHVTSARVDVVIKLPKNVRCVNQNFSGIQDKDVSRQDIVKKRTNFITFFKMVNEQERRTDYITSFGDK